MIRSLILTLLILSFAIFQTCSAQPSPKSFKYLALGDSYTIGANVPENQRWPLQLASKLKSAGVKDIQTRIIATTGWTTGDLIEALNQEKPDADYSLVSLLIGVNNEFQALSIDGYQGELEGLIIRAIAYAGGDTSRVFMLSIPDYGYTPFGIRQREKISPRIDQFNEVAKTICDRYKITWFDITEISRSYTAQMVAYDGLHPSGMQYGLWVDLILEDVLKIAKGN